jgi:hypothetical protein
MKHVEREPRIIKEDRPDIKDLLNILDEYLPIYDSLKPELQDEWDRAEAEAIGSFTDPTLDKETVTKNLKEFLDVLETATTKKAD